MGDGCGGKLRNLRGWNGFQPHLPFDTEVDVVTRIGEEVRDYEERSDELGVHHLRINYCGDYLTEEDTLFASFQEVEDLDMEGLGETKEDGVRMCKFMIRELRKKTKEMRELTVEVRILQFRLEFRIQFKNSNSSLLVAESSSAHGGLGEEQGDRGAQGRDDLPAGGGQQSRTGRQEGEGERGSFGEEEEGDFRAREVSREGEEAQGGQRKGI